MRRDVQFVLGFILVIAPLRAGAQTSTTTTAKTTEQSMDDTRKEFDRIEIMSRQVHDSSFGSRNQKSISPVLRAIPEFRKVTQDFRNAVGNAGDLRTPIRSLERLFKPFNEYFNELKMKTPTIDALEFKDYSENDLVWEALTTAERVDNNLQVSLILLRDSERSGTISIKTMQFLNTIQADMTRLKWLAPKVSTIRRLAGN